MIHIGLCADEKFSIALGVCMTSIFESNKGSDVMVHILTKGFLEKTIEKINRTMEIYHQEVKIYQIDDSLFDGYPLSSTFPKSIYFRYLFPKILPVEIDKILYFDCDTIIVSDLLSLWSTDISDKALAAIEDQNADDITNRNRIEIFDGKYFNSGVLLMNLNYWRVHDCFTQLAHFIMENPEKCLYPDQDALNVLFHENFLCLPFKYNFQLTLIKPFEYYKLNKSKWNDVVDSFCNLSIIHYVSPAKPWYKDTVLPLTNIWRYYKQLSLWKDMPYKNRNSLSLHIKNNIRMLFGGKDALRLRGKINPVLVKKLAGYEALYDSLISSSLKKK